MGQIDPLCRFHVTRRDDLEHVGGLGIAAAKGGSVAYFSPSWTAFQAERGRDFSVIVVGISN